MSDLAALSEAAAFDSVLQKQREEFEKQLEEQRRKKEEFEKQLEEQRKEIERLARLNEERQREALEKERILEELSKEVEVLKQAHGRLDVSGQENDAGGSKKGWRLKRSTHPTGEAEGDAAGSQGRKPRAIKRTRADEHANPPMIALADHVCDVLRSMRLLEAVGDVKNQAIQPTTDNGSILPPVIADGAVLERKPEQLFLCPIAGCNKTFHYRRNMTKHARFVHEGDSRQCQYCNKNFRDNHELKRHIRTHTGEKPYKCDAPGCGKCFSQSSHLADHKRRRHG